MPTQFHDREAVAPALAPDASIATVRAVLEVVFGPVAERDFGVRLWDDTEDRPPHRARFTLVLNHPAALRRLLFPPTSRHIGEAYLRNDFDVEGDIVAATAIGDRLERPVRSGAGLARIASRLLALTYRRVWSEASIGDGLRHRQVGLRHTRRRDAVAIRYHYDVGNDFYALWLDRRMAYSCAYFATGGEDLDTAQEAKLDLICRKLRLRAGERLLDIGCGWGGLILHAAEHYGVDATGITLSESQAALARERIARAGLGDRCRVEVRDYRDLPAGMQFDKLASVGMVEHVGQARLPVYFREAFRLLRPGGLFLNHGIVSQDGPVPRLWRSAVRPLRRWHSFIERYVFPDGEVLSTAENLAPAEAAGFELRDVENLREHYARTLRHWIQRLERRHAQAAAIVGEPTYRVWRLYMAGSARAFETARVGVIQTLLARPDGSGGVRIPSTRADLYAARDAEPSGH